jgi:hypothetical protein
VIDPSNVAVDLVGEPIREYLQHRDDAIRAVVTMFTDETSEIYHELSDSDQTAQRSADSDDELWDPVPLEALQCKLLWIILHF